MYKVVRIPIPVVRENIVCDLSIGRTKNMDKCIVTILYKWTVLKETWKTNYFGYPNKYDWESSFRAKGVRSNNAWQFAARFARVSAFALNDLSEKDACLARSFIVFANFTVGHCEYHAVDGSFEYNGSDVWWAYISGYTLQYGDDAQDGHAFIRVTDGGAEQLIKFNRSSSVTEFTVSAYSRLSSNGSGFQDHTTYGMECDLKHEDGTHSCHSYDQYVNFDVYVPEWHQWQLHILSQHGVITEADCYLMFRDGSGYADFDNFNLEACA